jgi:hypothetical protein
VLWRFVDKLTSQEHGAVSDDLPLAIRFVQQNVVNAQHSGHAAQRETVIN